MFKKKSATLAEQANAQIEGFCGLQDKLTQSFSINGKSESTLKNYLRCLAHLALHYKQSPERLSVENIEDYLYYCQKLHKTPSESFFKHTIFGLRAAYKVMGMEAKRVSLPQIRRDQKLPTVKLSKNLFLIFFVQYFDFRVFMVYNIWLIN